MSIDLRPHLGTLFVIFMLVGCGRIDAQTPAHPAALPAIAPPTWESVPGLGYDTEAKRSWVNPGWSEYLASEGPAWVRHYTSISAVVDSYDDPSLLTKEAYELGQDRIVAMMKKVPDEPKTLFMVTAHCSNLDLSNACHRADIFARLLASDEDNLFAYLVALDSVRVGFTHPKSKVVKALDTITMRRWILQAAQATQWRVYRDTMIPEQYSIALEYVRKFPPTDASQGALPDHVLAFHLSRQKSWLMRSPGFENLIDLCAHYRTVEIALSTACRAIARRLMDFRQVEGYTLKQAMASPADAASPAGLAHLRSWNMFTYVESCLRPRWLQRRPDWATLPRQFFEDYIQDLLHGGVWHAQRNSAVREFRVAPSVYEFPPDQCEALLDLDSDAMGIALGERDPLPNWQIMVRNHRLQTEDVNQVSDR
ncbi:MAG: hypothetical protein AAGG11_24185 [Pseudomonadota bacterium]